MLLLQIFMFIILLHCSVVGATYISIKNFKINN